MTKRPPFPSFFIIGAPRCGTTALSNALGKNPAICFSRPKEPHFFSWLRPASFGSDVQTDYISRFFSHYHPRHQVVGEGSTSYIFAAESIERILEINPDARFIAMVRNPTDMVLSYHLRLVYMLDEDVHDFAVAWRLQEKRVKGQMIPKRCRDPRLLQYGEAGRLGEHIARLYRTAGQERCMVISYDDFAANPRQTYQQALRFIGVEDDGRTVFRRKVSSRTYRNRALHELVYRGPTWSGKMLEQRAGQLAKRKGWLKRTRKRLVRANTIERRPSAIDPETRAMLCEFFAPDVDRLAQLLGRDFSHWR